MRQLIILVFAIACAGRPERSTEARSFMGLAVRDSAGAWCAEFSNDSLPVEGDSAMLVFTGDSSHISMRVRIGAHRTSDCSTAFPQPRWHSYTAYNVSLAETALHRESPPYLALVIGGNAEWIRNDRGVIHGDIDGDGVTEEIRRCAADEGEHFTVWSMSRNGAPIRRWHEYFDWGAIVDPTCAPGDDGR